MNLVKSAAVSWAITLAIATPGFAQTAVAGPASGSPLANDGPYAGASQTDFYHPADRIKQIQAEIQQGALAGPSARHAMAQLTAISRDLKYRIARHNGDLRDWDRELINQKLDALVKQYPALRT
jgi:N-formylglutamate amidohydrolase